MRGDVVESRGQSRGCHGGVAAPVEGLRRPEVCAVGLELDAAGRRTSVATSDARRERRRLAIDRGVHRGRQRGARGRRADGLGDGHSRDPVALRQERVEDGADRVGAPGEVGRRRRDRAVVDGQAVGDQGVDLEDGGSVEEGDEADGSRWGVGPSAHEEPERHRRTQRRRVGRRGDEALRRARVADGLRRQRRREHRGHRHERRADDHGETSPREPSGTAESTHELLHRAPPPRAICSSRVAPSSSRLVLPLLVLGERRRGEDHAQEHQISTNPRADHPGDQTPTNCGFLSTVRRTWA